MHRLLERNLFSIDIYSFSLHIGGDKTVDHSCHLCLQQRFLPLLYLHFENTVIKHIAVLSHLDDILSCRKPHSFSDPALECGSIYRHHRTFSISVIQHSKPSRPVSEIKLEFLFFTLSDGYMAFIWYITFRTCTDFINAGAQRYSASFIESVVNKSIIIKRESA